MCEPYKRIVAIAIPPDFGSSASSSEEEKERPCANCIGLAQTNFYHSLAEPKSVAMVRDKQPPFQTIARQLARISREDSRLGGVLFVTTERGAASEEDAEKFMRGILREAEDMREKEGGFLEKVPMGFSDPVEEKEGSWRELGNKEEEEDGEMWAPAAARVSARRLRTFLEKEQGALNTFG
jgi:hypothetical protein